MGSLKERTDIAAGLLKGESDEKGSEEEKKKTKLDNIAESDTRNTNE